MGAPERSTPLSMQKTDLEVGVGEHGLPVSAEITPRPQRRTGRKKNPVSRGEGSENETGDGATI